MLSVRIRAVVLLLCCWLVESTAMAQSPPQDVLQSARQAFKAGTTLANGAQWADALAAYERSAKLHPHATTSYNIAFCERSLGRYTRARVTFQRTLDQNDAAGGDELVPQLVKKSRGYLVELDHKLGRIQLTLAPPEVGVSIDGRPLAPHDEGILIAGTREPGAAESVGRTRVEVLVDPGDHTLLFVVGDKEQTRRVHVDAGGRVAVTFHQEAEPVEPRTPSAHYGAYVSWGLGGAAILSGIVAGAIALDRRNALGDACPARIDCPESARSDISLMQSASDISTAGFVVGAVTAALGTVLFFTVDTAFEVTLAPTQWGVRARF